MKYSSELPTIEGFYWYKNNYYAPQVVRICFYPSYQTLRQIHIADNLSKPLYTFNGDTSKWAGPIEEPVN